MSSPEGPPAEVLTSDLVEQVFGLRCLVVPDPVAGTPQVVPLGRDRHRNKETPIKEGGTE